MKKLLALILLSFLSSCIYSNQESLDVSLSINEKYSEIGGNRAIELGVIDERMNRDALGTKRFGQNLVNLRSNQIIARIVYDKVAKDLEQNGFAVVRGNLANKILEVKIITLNYRAYREFFVGTSKVEVLLKVTAKDKVGDKSYSTSKSLSLDKNHFISPSLSADEKTINSALQDALDEVLDNQKLIDFLKK